LTTAIDGVRICKTDHTVSPESSMSGTVLAVIAQGGKRLALETASTSTALVSTSSPRSTSQ
jgi:hypothetical protein